MCGRRHGVLALWVSTAGQEADAASPTEQKPGEELCQNKNQQETELMEEQHVYKGMNSLNLTKNSNQAQIICFSQCVI